VAVTIGSVALPELAKMHYRVVLQGRAVGGADIEHVKREFVRVTGLPAAVTDSYVNDRPQPIKRGLGRADAERIAATLRAIGAAASVEREVEERDDDGGEIQIAVHPLSVGPPSVIPGSAGAALAAAVVQRPRWVRGLRAQLPALVGVAVLAIGAVYLAPSVDEFVQTLIPARTPVVAALPRHAPAPPPPAAIPGRDATLLHGPWRCTDQRTGVATYWTYRDDGTVVFHGDALMEGPSPAAPAKDAPRAWRLADGNLVLTTEQGVVTSLPVEVLTLANLRYGDAGRGIAVDCRRP